MWLGVAVILLIIANSLFFFLRLDLTSGRAYTISDTTRKILKEAKAPIQITYYLSGKLKSQDPTFQVIEDILYEYGRASSGNASVAVVNPEGHETELGLDAKGIQPTNLNVSDRTQVSQALVYSGLVVNYLNQTRAVPFIQSPGELEYDLDAAIKQLDRKKDLTLGIISGVNGQQNDINHSFQIVHQEFGKMYKVSDVAIGTDIPADVDVLFVFNPEQLGKDTMTRVDQFIMSGKGVLLATDPVTVNLQYGMFAMPTKDAEVFTDLDKYGVSVEKSLVIDENNKPIPMTKQAGNLQYQQMVPYPFWVSTSPDDASKTNPITSHFNGTDFYWVSPVALKDGVKGEVLVSSSPTSTLVKDQMDISPQKAPAYLIMSQEEKKTRSLVVLRSGRIETAYPDDKLPLTATDNGRLIVAGNAGFASDLIKYTNSVQNLYFLKDLLEWLGNDEDLMKLRNRDIGETQLTKIKDGETRKAVASVAWGLSVVVVPLGVVVFGLVRAIRRRNLGKGKGVAA